MTTALNIGTLNLRGGFENKKHELVERANQFGLDVLALSDVRMKGESEDTLGDYRVFISGVKRGRANWGVGFLIHKNLESSIMCHRSVNERMMWVSIKIAGTVYRFISVYSPCDGANSDVMNDFYNDLNDIVYRKGNERVIVMGDLNARVGRNNPNFVNVLGKFGEDMVANGNGKRLLDFCQSSGLPITNSFFNHKKFVGKSWPESKDSSRLRDCGRKFA